MIKSWRKSPPVDAASATAARSQPRPERPPEPLAAVLASLESAVVAIDRDGRRVLSNPAADRMLPSLARVPQLMQQVRAVIDHPTAAGEAGDAAPIWTGRLSLPDERTLDVHIAPLPQGGCMVVARDISATVHLETTRRDFIAAISHELRTPLTSIQGYAEVLLQTPDLPSSTRAQFLQIMIDNANRLTRLAQDLVTLSSIETGTYPFHFATLDAAALVAPVLDVVAPLAQAQSAQITSGALVCGRVRGDRDALHRVLLNLVQNALVHGGNGVAIEISSTTSAGNYVFAVRDHGPGISAADQHRIFERFYRVDRGHAPNGTGLGLSLAKHIVIEHGGHLEVESALGQGSTFRLSLPLLP
ncbi:MAG TPA: ATP-binding protein [Terriglobales bacterium]|nr:ATP-binding protein [Terriglobales bacterium]